MIAWNPFGYAGDQMKPTIGRIVIYKLTAADKEQLKTLGSHHPNNGADEAPAMIVRVWGETTVNLQVMCDDSYNLWVTSAILGDGERQWSWPPRV